MMYSLGLKKKITTKNIRSRLKTIKKDYLATREALNQSGFGYDPALIEVTADEEAWEAYIEAYGLTETAGGVFRSVGPEESCQPGSTGRLSANCEAKIVNPGTGDALPPLEPGELWLRGPSVMKGYIGEEEENMPATDSNGWLKTGDLCYIDNRGYLYVVDRIKELIKYKGYQVAPAELEELLQSHSDIIDAAVIPYPDEETGEVPMAFVVKRPDSSLDEAKVMDFTSKQVSSYKKIRRVCFISSIPKNAPGKILRKDLIKLALSGPAAKL